MDLKEFKEKYENKLKEFGYEFDGAGEHGDWIQINYINKEKNTLITFGVDKKSNDAFANLLIFEGKEIKTEHNFPKLNELFEFLEKHRND